MISPKIWPCIHPFFPKYAPVPTPSSYCIGYRAILTTGPSYYPKRTLCTGENLHKCAQCGYSFDLAGNLKQHLLIHSGERPQKCQQCDHSSSYAAQLRDHIRTNYFQKPNQCKWYDYASITKSDLTKHVLTTVERSHVTALAAIVSVRQ